MFNDIEHRVHALLRQILSAASRPSKPSGPSSTMTAPTSPCPPAPGPRPCTACLPRNRCSWPVTQAPGHLRHHRHPSSLDATGQPSPLSLAVERHRHPSATRAPYALFAFSDADGRTWHFVNVQMPSVAGNWPRCASSAASSSARRSASARQQSAWLCSIWRRRLPSHAHPSLSNSATAGLLDVEAVTRAFFTAYRQAFERPRPWLRGSTTPRRCASSPNASSTACSSSCSSSGRAG